MAYVQIIYKIRTYFCGVINNQKNMDLLSVIIHFISAIDEKVFLFVNGMHCGTMDYVMFAVSDKTTWIPFYMLLAATVVRHGKWKQGVLCIAATLIAVGMADYTCASILRPMAERLRPSNPETPLSATVHIVNGYRGGRYGFPSCHAANSFALAVCLSLYLRNRAAAVLLTCWATLVSCSRIYLGVHYPGDVVCGMIVGSTYGIMSVKCYMPY